MTERIRSIGSEAELEDSVPRLRKGASQRSAGHGGMAREDEEAVGIIAQAQLGFAAKHSLAWNTGDGSRLDCHSLCGQVRADRREDHEAAGLRNVGGAAHDDFFGASPIDAHELEATSRGVRPNGQDADDDAGFRAQAEGVHRFDLEARSSQTRSEGLRVVGELRAKLAEPADRRFHEGR